MRGTAREVGPRTVNHVVCYCHDCRAFAHWLGRPDLLDASGGTDIVQLARSRLEIHEGLDQIRCVRLSRRGMHRWYARCCRTPLGNTVPRIPFVGVARAALDAAADDAAMFGAAIAANTKGAIGDAPGGAALTIRVVARFTRLLAAWAVRRLGHPTPFFDRENRPTVTPQVLTGAERDALRRHPRA